MRFQCGFLLLFLVLNLGCVNTFSGVKVEEKHTLNQSISAINIVQLLSQYAYSKVIFNANKSKFFFKEYFKSLDSQKLFFLQSDWDEFKAYDRKILDLLIKGDLKIGFSIFSRYQTRYREFIAYQLALIKDDLKKITLTRQEFLKFDEKHVNLAWMPTQEAQHDLWYKHMKNNIISMLLDGKDIQQISKALTKRYQNQLSRLNKIDSDDIFQNYINAFASLYDPHTQYLSPDNAKNFDIEMSLSLEGVGAALREENDYIKIHEIIPGGPVEKQGLLKPGDMIIGVGEGVDGDIADVVGMRLEDVVKLIRGKKGSIVRLSVITSLQNSKSKIYSIKRDKIKLEEQSANSHVFDVRIEHKDYKIGVIRIPTFYLDFKALQENKSDFKSTTRDVKALILKLKQQQVDGIIIDVRNNAGGSLKEAIQLTNMFVPHGPAVGVKGSDGIVYAEQDLEERYLCLKPLLVMINRLSASASEIFAAAIQDYDRGVLVGHNTYGKGTVQTLQPLREGQLKFTMAKFYRVSGKSTQRRGVMPDIEFPDLYNDEQIGENILSTALSWDTIKPIQPNHEKWVQKEAVASLVNKFEAKKKNIAYFEYIKATNQLHREFFNKKKQSLVFDVRKEASNAFKKQQLVLENAFRNKEKKSIFKTYKAFEKHQADKASQSRKYKIEEDPYVTESVWLLSELMHDVSQRQASHLMHLMGLSDHRIRLDLMFWPPVTSYFYFMAWLQTSSVWSFHKP